MPVFCCCFLGYTGALRFASTLQLDKATYTSLRRATGKIEEMTKAGDQPLAVDHDEKEQHEKGMGIAERDLMLRVGFLLDRDADLPSLPCIIQFRFCLFFLEPGEGRALLNYCIQINERV